TKLTWDNAALISPGTADRLRLISGDVVDLKQGDRTLRIPVWLAPGQAPDTLTLHLGYGRTRAGRAGNGTGFNLNTLRTMVAPDILGGVELTRRATPTTWPARRTTGRSKVAIWCASERRRSTSRTRNSRRRWRRRKGPPC